MPVIIDIEKDSLYKKGYEKGFEEGYRKGVLQGFALAIQVIQLYKEGKSAQEIESITNLPKEEVLRIIQKLTNL